MGYEEEPDYEGLRTLFKNIMERNGYVDDKQFDWILKRNSNPNMINVEIKFFFSYFILIRI